MISCGKFNKDFKFDLEGTTDQNSKINVNYFLITSIY